VAGSYYGTFDQGGNVREWTEGISASSRIVRGGAWNGNDANLRSSNRNPSLPLSEVESIGFRIVFIPEPTVGVMMVLGMALLVWKRKLSA
jgi:formylglycine-generating enzyme required for sulfatase activity